jgi:hypothetical protein
MVLRVPETPEHAREAVRAVLDTPRRRSTPSQDADPAESDTADSPCTSPGPTPFTAVCPHRMYEVDLADLAAGRGVDAARPVGWRWLVHDGDHTVGAVEVADPGSGHPVARFTEGPFTTCTDAAVATVRSLPQIERGYYELRLLHIPGLYTVALWLADLVGWKDLLVPLAPAPPGVQALRPYPADELARVLGARGRTVLTAAVQT